MKAEKVRKFLAGLTDLEYRYLRLQCQVANDARTIVHKHNISREEFCIEMKISQEEYDAYMTGGFNYTLMDMARLQALYIRYETKRVAEEAKKTVTTTTEDDVS